MATALVRELPMTAHELMLDIGSFDWVTVYVIGTKAFILPPDKRTTEALLKNKHKQKEISEFLGKEFEVIETSFPLRE